MKMHWQTFTPEQIQELQKKHKERQKAQQQAQQQDQQLDQTQHQSDVDLEVALEQASPHAQQRKSPARAPPAAALGAPPPGEVQDDPDLQIPEGAALLELVPGQTIDIHQLQEDLEEEEEEEESAFVSTNLTIFV